MNTSKLTQPWPMNPVLFKPMKVAFLLSQVNVVTTGFIKEQIRIANSFADVEIISLNDDVQEFEGMPVHSIPFKQALPTSVSNVLLWPVRRIGLMNYYRDSRFGKQLQAVLASINADVLHVQFGQHADVLFTHIPDFSCPTIVQFRGRDASSRVIARPAYRRHLVDILNRPNVFTASVCDALIHHLKKQGVPVKCHSVLHTPIDTEFFSPKRPVSPAHGTKRLVQIGSFREKKGQLQLLKLFEAYSKEHPDAWQLHLYGEGETKEKCREFAKSKGLTNQVQFHSWLDRNQVKEVLNEADAFVHLAITPSNGDMEGIPNAIAEAMSMELPVITTDHSGIPELITSHDEGRIIEIDPAAFKETLNELREGGKMPKARTRVCEAFSLEQHKAALQALYRQTLDRNA